MLDASYLSDLWFFRAAAQLESFSQAAEVLNITQGAVSQRMRRLEARLGVSLFERVGRGVVLTPTGKRLLETTRSFELIELGLQAIKLERSRDELVLSCIPSFAMDWLIPRLNDWYREPDSCKLRIRAELVPISKEMMVKEGIHFALCYDHNVYEDLHVEEMRDESLVAVCAPGHPLPGPGQTLAEYMSSANLIHDGDPWVGAEPTTEWMTWLRGAGMDQVDANRGDFFNLTHLATRAALLGQGIAIGRSLFIKEYIATGKLRPVAEIYVPSPTSYRLVSLPELAEHRFVRSFTRWLKKELGGV